MAVGENGMHGQGRSARGAALEDSEEELLVVTRDADEARKTGFDDLRVRVMVWTKSRRRRRRRRRTASRWKRGG
jgi:hypothetical protein